MGSLGNFGEQSVIAVRQRTAYSLGNSFFAGDRVRTWRPIIRTKVRSAYYTFGGFFDSDSQLQWACDLAGNNFVEPRIALSVKTPEKFCDREGHEVTDIDHTPKTKPKKSIVK